jgi:hypothetical protein
MIILVMIYLEENGSSYKLVYLATQWWLQSWYNHLRQEHRYMSPLLIEKSRPVANLSPSMENPLKLKAWLRLV